MAQQIEDITENNTRKKGINSGDKGDRGEREVIEALNRRFAKLLSEHPDWGHFVRAAGSGAFGHRNLSQAGKDTYIGDISAPSNFKWVLESKLGYNDIDLFTAFAGGCPQLDEFLKQVESDAERSNTKRPLLLWRKDRRKRIAALKTIDLIDKSFIYTMQYRDWTIISFEDLLVLNDSFFFNV